VFFSRITRYFGGSGDNSLLLAERYRFVLILVSILDRYGHPLQEIKIVTWLLYYVVLGLGSL